MAGLLTILAATLLLLSVMALWVGLQMLAMRRLGERRQGCGGPVKTRDGTLLCCKGDGSLCEETGDHQEHAQGS